MKKLVALGLLLAVAGCSPSTSTTSEPAPLSSSKAPATPAAKDFNASLTQFERDNAITPDQWGGVVSGREVKFNNSLWVYTKLSDTAEAKATAAKVCGAYGQYVLMEPKVTVTFVRASTGLQLAKCGPGA